MEIWIVIIALVIYVFVIRYVFRINEIAGQLAKINRLLEAMYKQNGGTVEQLYPELYRKPGNQQNNNPK